MENTNKCECTMKKYCINKDTDACASCIRSPRNVFRSDNFRRYKPVCRYGYSDCINDPACEKYWRNEWYLKFYGDISPEEAVQHKRSCCVDCTNGSFYDDEDK